MGPMITCLTPTRGFCAETGGAVTPFMAPGLGVPVSTTLTVAGTIVGVGAAAHAVSGLFGRASAPRRRAGSTEGKEPMAPKQQHSLADSVSQLEADLARVRADPAFAPRTARLLQASVTKAAKKLAEEAVEMALDAVRGDKPAVIAEAADLLYNFVVLLDRTGITSEEVWAEMERRRATFGIAAKLPKPPASAG